MNKYIVILNLVFFPLFSYPQSFEDKIAKEICECLEKEKPTTPEEMKICFEKTFAGNLGEVYKHFNVSSIEEVDFETLGAEIGYSMTKNCDYMINHFREPTTKFEEDFKTKENLKCSDFKEGDFYYLLKNIDTNQNDTTYVTINDKMFLERMNHGKTYSLLEIDWINECEFELTFKNSNDTMKNAFSKEGDKYKYQVVDRTQNSLILKLNWNNQAYRFEMFKLK